MPYKNLRLVEDVPGYIQAQHDVLQYDFDLELPEAPRAEMSESVRCLRKQHFRGLAGQNCRRVAKKLLPARKKNLKSSCCAEIYL